MKSQKVTFQKSQKLLADNLRERPSINRYSEHSIAIHSNSKAGYVRRAVRSELRARESSSFCDF